MPSSLNIRLSVYVTSTDKAFCFSQFRSTIKNYDTLIDRRYICRAFNRLIKRKKKKICKRMGKKVFFFWKRTLANLELNYSDVDLIFPVV